MKQITGRDLSLMTDHWMNTPPNGYLGSDYGQNANLLLQNPQKDLASDKILKKLKNDVPILGVIGANAVSMYEVSKSYDQSDIVLVVADQTYNLSDGVLNAN